MGRFLDSPGDDAMSKVDEGLIRLCVDQFQVIATKVETSVHNKRTVDERYHQALQKAVEQVAAQAEAARGVEKDDLIRAVRGRLKAQIFMLEPSSKTLETHLEREAIKRADIFREAVDLLTKQLPAAE
jgi:hypothetical protein